MLVSRLFLFSYPSIPLGTCTELFLNLFIVPIYRCRLLYFYFFGIGIGIGMRTMVFCGNSYWQGYDGREVVAIGQLHPVPGTSRLDDDGVPR